MLNVQIGEFATLNPFLSSGIGRGSVNAAIYMPLVFLGADNTIQPGVASAWEQSEDGLTYTFTIRDDLVWSDGEPLDSGDVLWSFSKYLDADLSQWASRIGGVAGQGEAEVPSGLSAPGPDDVRRRAGRAQPVVADGARRPGPHHRHPPRARLQRDDQRGVGDDDVLGDRAGHAWPIQLRVVGT